MLDFFTRCLGTPEKGRARQEAHEQAPVLADGGQTCTRALVHVVAAERDKPSGTQLQERADAATVEQLYSCLTSLTQAGTAHDGWVLNLEAALGTVRDHFGACTARCVRGHNW